MCLNFLQSVHDLEHPQIWEVLSDAGVESAVIGAMNAKRGNTKSGIFLPDPWSKKNDAYPESLRALWTLISGRVQSHAATQPSTKDVVESVKACWKLSISPAIIARIGWQIVYQRFNEKKKWRLAALFDEFLAEIFLFLVNNDRYKFCSLFLNAIAHYQHHFWRQFDRSPFSTDIVCPDCAPSDDPIRYGYETYDKIIGKILKSIDLSRTVVVIASGLSQIPDTRHEQSGGMNYYRLKDHTHFASLLGIQADRVFPLMSRDWQILYNSLAEKEKMRSALSACRVDGEPLFEISNNTEGFLFVETAVTKCISPGGRVHTGNGPTIPFEELFVNIAIKSGHHTGVGSLWISDPAYVTANEDVVPLTSLFTLPQKALLGV